MPREKESLALVTPTPTILRVLNAYAVIEKDCIMTTLACVMWCDPAVRRTHPLARMPGEKESLALVTPSPIPLLGAAVYARAHVTRPRGCCGFASQHDHVS